MHKFQLVALLTLSIFPLLAQEDSERMYPEKRLQLGWYFTNTIFNGDPVFDLAYRIKGRHVLGLGVGFYQDVNNRFTINQDTMDHGEGVKLYHRFYLFRTDDNNFLYLQHGLRLRRAAFVYYITDFYEFHENGSTFLRKETRQFRDMVTQAGYEILFGAEMLFNNFFIDFHLGIGIYNSKYNEEYLQQDPEFHHHDTRHSGSIFLGGIRMGFYLY